MSGFTTQLVAGRKPPYDTWTFVIVPADLADAWGAGPVPVTLEIHGTLLRATAT